jgi:hypothetical protein
MLASRVKLRIWNSYLLCPLENRKDLKRHKIVHLRLCLCPFLRHYQRSVAFSEWRHFIEQCSCQTVNYTSSFFTIWLRARSFKAIKDMLLIWKECFKNIHVKNYKFYWSFKAWLLVFIFYWLIIKGIELN